jgi:hypothetical protein
MKVKNFTAYCINGDLYIRKGKPNAKTFNQIVPIREENQKDKKRREILKAVHCHSLVYGWEEETKSTQTKLPFNN